MSNAVAGTLVANGSSPAFSPLPGGPGLPAQFSAAVYGTFVATMTLQKSYDGGATWSNESRPDFTDAAFTAPVNLVATEPATGVEYRWTCSGYASGTVSYVLGP